jgi:uncharacterized protein (DUF433 family)
MEHWQTIESLSECDDLASAAAKSTANTILDSTCFQNRARWPYFGLKAPSTQSGDKIRSTRMSQFDRITFDPAVMGGKPCIRGQRVTVGTVLGLLAAGRSRDEILKAYPYLDPEDIDQSLAYAAWRMEERDVPLATA